MEKRKIAVAGSKGPDPYKGLLSAHWGLMSFDLRQRIGNTDLLLSNGGAWADHLPVVAYLEGWCSEIALFLPAAFLKDRFIGPPDGPARMMNEHHVLFSKAAGIDSMTQLSDAIRKGALVSIEPPLKANSSLVTCNHKTAINANSVISYTLTNSSLPGQEQGASQAWAHIPKNARFHVRLDEQINKSAVSE